jgi:hypothetical protein
MSDVVQRLRGTRYTVNLPVETTTDWHFAWDGERWYKLPESQRPPIAALLPPREP